MKKKAEEMKKFEEAAEMKKEAASGAVSPRTAARKSEADAQVARALEAEEMVVSSLEHALKAAVSGEVRRRQSIDARRVRRGVPPRRAFGRRRWTGRAGAWRSPRRGNRRRRPAARGRASTAVDASRSISAPTSNASPRRDSWARERRQGTGRELGGGWRTDGTVPRVDGGSFRTLGGFRTLGARCTHTAGVPTARRFDILRETEKDHVSTL